MVVTHLHDDHIGCLPELIKNGDITLAKSLLMNPVFRWKEGGVDTITGHDGFVDATQKLKRLSSLGHYNQELGNLNIKVAIDKEAKTLTISDSGIGMTAEEIKKYINQVAFSGATEFMEKFKEANDANEIIGRFGLGFYSAFMVSEKVEIQTLSYQEGASPARWTCDGSTEFENLPGQKNLL